MDHNFNEQKAAELEAQARDIRHAMARQRNAEEQQRRDAMEKAGAPKPYWSDDYAGFDAGDVSAYFGYEETGCHKHPEGDPEGDCDDCEWCFVLKRGEQQIARIRKSELNVGSGFPEPQECLIAALALCISRGILHPASAPKTP